MERLCFQFNIHEGAESEYDQRHDEIWPEMEVALRDSGWNNYSLFRRGTNVIGYCECEPDVATALERMGDTDVNERWQESMSHLIADITDEQGNLYRFPEVWHLDET